jgi:diguanylate cyclase (GGDEF)-like protein/PAS domain S-box-containing protein
MERRRRAPLPDAGAVAPRWTGSPAFLAYASGPVSFALLCGMRDVGWIAWVPVWVYVVIWLVPAVASTILNLFYRRHPTRLGLNLRAAMNALAATLFIYVTGWGPVLGVVYLVAAEHLVATAGAATWRISRRWAFAGMIAGQIGIETGWFPHLLPKGAGNGVAVLGAFSFVLVSRMAETIAAEREQAWEEVRVSGERFQSLVQSSSDLVVVMDTAGNATYVSGASERILGLTPGQLRGADLGALMHPDDIERVRQSLTEALNRPEPTQAVEFRVRHADGDWRSLEAVGTNLKDNPAVGGVVLNVRDVTDRKRAEAELAHQAVHDALTGLPNRALFLDRLAEGLSRAGTDQEQPAVLFLDVDRFKLINDTLGHDVGDQLLVEVAARLRSSLRGSDMVARFGGDEFVILCDRRTDLETISGRLLAAFTEPFWLRGEPYYLSASVGVAAPDGPVASPGELVRDADTAMYRAKELGRGRVYVFDETARAGALARVHTEHLLRAALEHDQFRLLYQPIVDARTREVASVEALLRWNHPQHGLLAPAQFMATAEDSGLIVPIGTWVLAQALGQALSWAELGCPTMVSVNLSARQLAEDSIVATLRDLLALLRPAGGTGPLLTVEVTESVFVRDPAAAAARLAEIKELGVRLSMDDFGTGYSSLANLRGYPFDSIKIDRTFVAGIAEPGEDRAIVEAMIDLAHGLGRIVIAEGVETPEQLAVLARLNCDLVQGFELGSPVPAPARPDELLRSSADRTKSEKVGA